MTTDPKALAVDVLLDHPVSVTEAGQMAPGVRVIPDADADARETLAAAAGALVVAGFVVRLAASDSLNLDVTDPLAPAPQSDGAHLILLALPTGGHA